jgi:hypothetical protein
MQAGSTRGTYTTVEFPIPTSMGACGILLEHLDSVPACLQAGWEGGRVCLPAGRATQKWKAPPATPDLGGVASRSSRTLLSLLHPQHG